MVVAAVARSRVIFYSSLVISSVFALHANYDARYERSRNGRFYASGNARPCLLRMIPIADTRVTRFSRLFDTAAREFRQFAKTKTRATTGGSRRTFLPPYARGRLKIILVRGLSYSSWGSRSNLPARARIYTPQCTHTYAPSGLIHHAGEYWRINSYVLT